MKNRHFESWYELCDAVIDFATTKAKNDLDEELTARICRLSDEIIDTAEVYEPEANH